MAVQVHIIAMPARAVGEPARVPRDGRPGCRRAVGAAGHAAGATLRLQHQVYQHPACMGTHLQLSGVQPEVPSAVWWGYWNYGDACGRRALVQIGRERDDVADRRCAERLLRPKANDALWSLWVGHDMAGATASS